MRLDVLVGMIASGKSTYALQRAREGALVISHDDLTAMLHAEYRYEQGLRACYQKMEASLASLIFFHERDCLVDRTNLTIEARKRWVDFARAEMEKVIAVVFPVETPEIHADRRMHSDPRGRSYEDWLKVAEHHHAQYLAEPISANEGFDRIEYVEWRDGRVVPRV